MIVVGLGSPFLSDDSVGPRVVRELARLGTVPEAHLTEAHAGGLLLVEELAGYDQAVIVDALIDPSRPPGTVVVAGVGQASQNLACSHDCTLSEALVLGRSMGLHLPEDRAIHLVAVVTSDVTTFSDSLTPAVEAALPRACAAVRTCLSEARRSA